MDERCATRASTPGGHRLIRAAWSAGVVLLIVGAGVAAVRGVRAALLVLAFALILFVAGYVSYLVRHFRFLRDVSRAEDALRRGDHERARGILAPLLELDRKSTRLNSSHIQKSRMPSSA